MTTTPTFSDHTSNSVKVDSVRICYGNTGGSFGARIYPIATNSTMAQVWEGGPVKHLKSNSGKAVCDTWYVNKKFTKQKAGDVVRFQIRMNAGENLIIANFDR